MKKQTPVEFLLEQLECLYRERRESLIDAETFYTQKISLIEEAKVMEAEREAKYNGMFEIGIRFDSELFTPPFRLGRKQKRAILDSKGREVIIMPHNSEKQAKLYCDYLNGNKNEL